MTNYLMPPKYHKDAFRLLSLMDPDTSEMLEALDFYSLIKMDEEDIARLMYLLGMGYITMEPVSEEYALTDKGEEFLRDYNPKTGHLHNWDYYNGVPFRYCKECGEWE